MEILTQTNLPSFAERLRTLLEGQRFTFEDLHGHIFPGACLRSLSDITVTHEGLHQVWLGIGQNIQQPFTAYFVTADGPPILRDSQLHRTSFEFSDQGLCVYIEYLAPTMNGYAAIMRFNLH